MSAKTAAAILLLACCGSGAAQPARLGFRQVEQEFVFDTGLLRGKLRSGGRSLGLSDVVHIPTGRTLSRSMGLFGHYRVFTTNRRHGDGAWSWPSRARLREDGSVEVHWAAAADRPFELWAVYRWSAPGVLDLETRVRALSDLEGFESFLASYFAEAFTVARVWTQESPAGAGAAWVSAELEDGIWQIFPRDHASAALIQDGRWGFPPSPVQWAVRPLLSEPLGMRQAEAWGLTALVMAPRSECFAVATPHGTEPHYSMYLSLFGQAVGKGETARARARLQIEESPSDERIVELYRAYLRELSAGSR